MGSILVTGGAGFIGSNFVRYWQKNYPKDLITVIDNLSTGGKRTNVPSRIPFIKMDICAIRDAVFDTIVHFAGVRAFPTIVHFAAESHVDRSIEASAPFIHSNIVGTHVLLEAALKHECRFHHVSTDEVFGSLGPYDPSFTETSRYDPKSPYAASKAASDHLVRAYIHTYGLQATITSCCNNYGPRQSTEKLMPLMITNAMVGMPLPVYGDGTNRREWLYVEDHCRAIDLVLKKGKIGETYNVGSGVEMSNLEMVEAICDAVPCSKDLITFVKDRPGHDWRYATNWQKLANLGFKPTISFYEGLKRTVEWYRNEGRAVA